jgi:PIN domain nuclease of toxin-antitoxin system
MAVFLQSALIVVQVIIGGQPNTHPSPVHLPLHKDPFDRMLVAQAAAEGMLLLTADEKVAAYGGAVLQV